MPEICYVFLVFFDNISNILNAHYSYARAFSLAPFASLVSPSWRILTSLKLPEIVVVIFITLKLTFLLAIFCSKMLHAKTFRNHLDGDMQINLIANKYCKTKWKLQ